MTQQEHLNRIRARCVELLEIAEKRTAGRWTQDHIYVDTDDKAVFIKADGNSNNAAFIAAAAGPFEAALASTVAAIDGIIDPESSQTTHNWSLMHNRFTIKQIIASWPLELLQQK